MSFASLRNQPLLANLSRPLKKCQAQRQQHRCMLPRSRPHRLQHQSPWKQKISGITLKMARVSRTPGRGRFVRRPNFLLSSPTLSVRTRAWEFDHQLNFHYACNSWYVFLHDNADLDFVQLEEYVGFGKLCLMGTGFDCLTILRSDNWESYGMVGLLIS